MILTLGAVLSGSKPRIFQNILYNIVIFKFIKYTKKLGIKLYNSFLSRDTNLCQRAINRKKKEKKNTLISGENAFLLVEKSYTSGNAKEKARYLMTFYFI